MPSLATGLGQGFAGLASGVLQGRKEAFDQGLAARELGMKQGYLDIAQGNYLLNKREADLTYDEKMRQMQAQRDIAGILGSVEGGAPDAAPTPPGAPAVGATPSVPAAQAPMGVPVASPATAAPPAAAPAAPAAPAGPAPAQAPQAFPEGTSALPGKPISAIQQDQANTYLAAARQARAQGKGHLVPYFTAQAAQAMQAAEEQKGKEFTRALGDQAENLNQIVGLLGVGDTKGALDRINTMKDAYGRPMFGGNVTDIKQVGSYEKNGAIMPVFQTTTSDGQTHRIDAGALLAMAQTSAKDKATVLKNTEDYLVGQGKNEAEMARALAERLSASKPTDFQFAYNKAFATNGGKTQDALQTAMKTVQGFRGIDENAALQLLLRSAGIEDSLMGLDPGKQAERLDAIKKTLGIPAKPSGGTAESPAAAVPSAAPAPAAPVPAPPTPPPAAAAPTAPAAPKTDEQKALEKSMMDLGLIPPKKQAKTFQGPARQADPFYGDNRGLKRRATGLGQPGLA